MFKGVKQIAIQNCCNDCWGHTVWNQSVCWHQRRNQIELGLLCVVVVVVRVFLFYFRIKKHTKKKTCVFRFPMIYRNFWLEIGPKIRDSSDWFSTLWLKMLCGDGIAHATAPKKCAFLQFDSWNRTRTSKKFHFYFRKFWAKLITSFVDSLRVLLALGSHTFDNWWKNFSFWQNVMCITWTWLRLTVTQSKRLERNGLVQQRMCQTEINQNTVDCVNNARRVKTICFVQWNSRTHTHIHSKYGDQTTREWGAFNGHWQQIQIRFFLVAMNPANFQLIEQRTERARISIKRCNSRCVDF